MLHIYDFNIHVNKHKFVMNMLIDDRISIHKSCYYSKLFTRNNKSHSLSNFTLLTRISMFIIDPNIQIYVCVCVCVCKIVLKLILYKIMAIGIIYAVGWTVVKKNNDMNYVLRTPYTRYISSSICRVLDVASSSKVLNKTRDLYRSC